MSEAKKDMAYYLAHPDEMPTDPAEIEKLANEHIEAALESGTDQLTVERFVKPDEKTDPSPDKAAADAKAAEEAKAAEDAKAAKDAADKAEREAAEAAEAAKATDKKPGGILAKDGKNVIPYSQLESARQRATEAERLLAERTAEVERLKAAKEAGENTETDIPTLTDEDFKALEEDSPTLAKLLKAQQSTIQQLTDKVGTLTTRTQQREATEQAEIKSEIQTAIDANPTLAEWQNAEDQTMWSEAARIDKTLRESPRYANVSFADRFNKVVALTRIALDMEPEQEPETKPEEKPSLTPEQVRQAAEAKLKAKPAAPKSLSDIPGGAPPAVDERDRVEQMSVIELGNKFQSMSKEQLEAYLATL